MNRPKRKPPAFPFVGHVLWIIRTIPYREPDYEEWSEDGAILYECTDHRGDFLEVVDVEKGEVSWINLATVAEIRLACECGDGDGDAGGPPISFTLGDPPGDPSRN